MKSGGGCRPSEAWLFAAVFVFLTILVWGLFAFDRGLFQDDVSILSAVRSSATPAQAFFGVVTSPTRRLVRVPYALALLSGRPREALQAMCGGLWLLSGVLAVLVLGEIFPRQRRLSFVGGCLVLCSTGDYLVDSVVSLHYEFSALCFFAAFYSLLRWRRSGKLPWLVAMAAFLAGSLWTTDGAFASAILVPLVFAVGTRLKTWKRTAAAASIWYAIFGLYFAVFLRFLRDPKGYAARAIRPMGLEERLAGAFRLFAHNFDLWSWGPGRRNWFPALPRILPARLCAGLAVLGALAFLAGYFRLSVSRPGEVPASEPSRRRLLALSGAFLLLAFASNAIFAAVQYSEFFYRTQTVSRYWSAFALATLCAAAARSRRLAGIAAAVPAIFVVFGVYGGLDRQDYYLGYWRRHREALRSVAAAAPRPRGGAFLIFEAPAEPHPYMATDTPYLLDSWLDLLYGDARISSFLWGPVNHGTCAAEGEVLRCTGDSHPGGASFPLRQAVILSYSVEKNRYSVVARDELRRRFPLAGAEAYNPERLVEPGPVSGLARDFLDGRELLARFLRRVPGVERGVPVSAPRP